MESKAILRGVKVSAQKARLVANVVRGMPVAEAIQTLTFMDKKSALIIRKLVESAIANAEVSGERSGESVDVDALQISTIFVDAGPTQIRFRPRAQGRATPIQKKSSHITVVLTTA
jgi:large subunit ribosomal protein L22